MRWRGGVAVGVAVALSAAARSSRPGGVSGAIATTKLCRSYERSSSAAGRVGRAQVEQLREALSERDWAVTGDVARLRLVTGAQLERLHFADLADGSRAVVRRRVLGRLVRERVLATLERRIGGVRAGSAGLVYSLDTAGYRLVAADGGRRAGLPGGRYMRHVLAVSELYASLVDVSRHGQFRLITFDAEPASWWPDSRGGVLKPDAAVRVEAGAHRDNWWIEVDRATESLPTLRAKLMVYLDFYNRGGRGPEEIMPWILITVPDAKRHSDVVRLIRQLPSGSESLFVVTLDKDAVDEIMRVLTE
jgi:hypothetical protein